MVENSLHFHTKIYSLDYLTSLNQNLLSLSDEPVFVDWPISVRDVVVRYLYHFGLEPFYFVNKEVVDIGCGHGLFKRGIESLVTLKNFVNLDINDQRLSPDVIADAARLPLADESFDLVLAFGSIAGVYWVGEALDQLEVLPFDPLWEIARILRTGGLAKIGPISLLSGYWKDDNTGFLYEKIRPKFVSVLTKIKHKYPNTEIEITRQVYEKRFDEWITLKK